MADQNRITAAYEMLAEESRNHEAAQAAAPPVPADHQAAYTAIMARLDDLHNGMNNMRNDMNNMRNETNNHFTEVNNNIEGLRQELVTR
jgi:hypothetical protein